MTGGSERSGHGRSRIWGPVRVRDEYHRPRMKVLSPGSNSFRGPKQAIQGLDNMIVALDPESGPNHHTGLKF